MSRSHIMIARSCLIVVALLIFGRRSISQCPSSVTHTVGMMNIDSVSVTVTSSGYADTFTTYCQTTLPYFIGYDWATSASDDGSYTFTFVPPVEKVDLSFSGITNRLGDIEEIILRVNGAFYSVDSVGPSNGCDSLAVLTPGGHIGGCSGCPVSGWTNTVIEGPISSLTVKDSVLNGSPSGALFSLSFCRFSPDPGSDPSECVPGIPSAFSPNGDNVNDRFSVLCEVPLSSFQLMVYNRWGEKVFETRDPGSHWDGTYKGSPSPGGVYVYSVLYSCNPGDDVEKQSGHVTLVR